MTRSDRLLVAALAAIALLSWPVTLLAGTGRASGVRISGPGGSSVVQTDQTMTVEVEGSSGGMRVLTGPGGARVLDSGCPDHLCVAQGQVSAPGAVLVCAPNGVTVTVGGGDDALDATVR